MSKPTRFHPGIFIREELEARGWSFATFCEKAELRHDVAEELLAEKRSVTPIIAYCLGLAFGTGREVWLNLQRSYDER